MLIYAQEHTLGCLSKKHTVNDDDIIMTLLLQDDLR